MEIITKFLLGNGPVGVLFLMLILGARWFFQKYEETSKECKAERIESTERHATEIRTMTERHIAETRATTEKVLDAFQSTAESNVKLSEAVRGLGDKLERSK